MLTTTDGGETYTSHASDERLHDVQHRPARRQPNNACQDDLRQRPHRHQRLVRRRHRGHRPQAGRPTPTPVFLADSYDISDLAGEAERRAAVQLRHRPGPGPARLVHRRRQGHRRPSPARTPREVLVTDFETSGGPDDPRVFNGGCREDLTTAQQVHAGLEVRRRPAPSRPPTTPTTSRCGTAPASTSTATARSTATRSAFAAGLLPRLHRRGARLRQRRHRRPAGAVAAGLRAGARATTTPDLNDAAFVDSAGPVDVLRRAGDPARRQLHRPEQRRRATGSSATTAWASTVTR